MEPISKIAGRRTYQQNPLVSTGPLVEAKASSTTGPLEPIGKPVEAYKVDEVLDRHADLINPHWRSRHAKAIQEFGIYHYEKMANYSRQKAQEGVVRDPQAYLAGLLNKMFRRQNVRL